MEQDENQKTVAASNEKLTTISPKVLTWAVRKVAGRVCFRTSAYKCTCGDCGRHFDHKGKGKSVCCPHCGTRLQIKDTLKRTIKEAYYFLPRSNRPFAGATGIPFGNDLPERNAYGGRLLGKRSSIRSMPKASWLSQQEQGH